MRILQICNKPPFPPVDGGCVAMNAITSGLLANGHSVKVLAVSTQKHPFLEKQIPEAYLKNTSIETVFIDTSLSVSKGFVNLFTGGSYNIERFYSKDFQAKLEQILKNDKYDVVQFESIFVAPYLETVKQLSKAKTVLRAHNVEHLIWQRMASQTSNPLKKWYLRFLAKRLKEYEMNVLNNFDGIAAITADDKKYLLENNVLTKSDVFPLGIDSAQYNPAQMRDVEFPSLFHLGSMDWMPNEEAIKWFLEKVWMDIHAAFPTLKLYLAGRNMPEWLHTLQLPNVIITGEVANAHDFMRQKAMMIVPLLSGGGMRVKIIEGMVLGKVIVSTTIGAEGIEVKDSSTILIANTAEEFVQQIGKCINDSDFYNRISVNARKFALANYDYKEVADKLTRFYKQL
ncbi:MAG: glycosyltransferase family 4 protein [Bacteroidia bacterium]